MSRARNIKPGFFKNDRLAECEPLARILFQGLWCEADRAGRLEDRPKRLKAECLPYDDCDIDALLGQLAERGFIVRYQVGNERYIAIPTFSKHQNPHVKEIASSIPAPDLHCASPVQVASENDSGTGLAGLIPSSLIPDSPSLKGDGPPKGGLTFSRWVESLNGAKPIPAGASVFSYAAKVGIPDDLLALAWYWFENTYGQDGSRAKKRYTDWPGVFRRAVEGNWAKAWFADASGYKLSTVGEQLRRESEAAA